MSSQPVVYVLEAQRTKTSPWLPLPATGRDGHGTFRTKQQAVRFATDLSKWEGLVGLRVLFRARVVWQWHRETTS